MIIMGFAPTPVVLSLILNDSICLIAWFFVIKAFKQSYKYAYEAILNRHMN